MKRGLRTSRASGSTRRRIERALAERGRHIARPGAWWANVEGPGWKDADELRDEAEVPGEVVR
jgi:hypothetical protein